MEVFSAPELQDKSCLNGIKIGSKHKMKYLSLLQAFIIWKDFALFLKYMVSLSDQFPSEVKFKLI